jgi:hypothetical protein
MLHGVGRWFDVVWAALLLYTAFISRKSVEQGQTLKSHPKARFCPWKPERPDASLHLTPQLLASGKAYEVAVDKITL